MAENISDRNGRALEYIVCLELGKLKGFTLTNQSRLLNERDKDKYSSLPSSLKSAYSDASSKISTWAKSLFQENSQVTVDRQTDNPDDPSDFILKSNSKKISISLKHNHEALKHPRPYSFAQACGFSKGSLQDNAHRSRMKTVSNNFRNSNPGQQVFNQCGKNEIDKLYFEVCNVCEISLKEWMKNNDNIALILFDFLVSNGFYKVIVDTRNGINVKVQDYLNIPQPDSVKTTVNKNRLKLDFDNEWILNLRIHTASNKISKFPSQLSLKFDAQKEIGDVNEFIL